MLVESDLCFSGGMLSQTEIQGTIQHGPHTRGVYPTQDTSRMATAMVK